MSNLSYNINKCHFKECNFFNEINIDFNNHCINTICKCGKSNENIRVDKYNDLMLSFSENSFCSYCKQELKGLIYCIDCNKVYCVNCEQNHQKLYKNHKIILNEKYCFLCKKHLKKYNAYYNEKKENICQDCIKELNIEYKKLSIFSKIMLNNSDDSIIKKIIKDIKDYKSLLSSIYISWSKDSKYSLNISKEKGQEIMKNYNILNNILDIEYSFINYLYTEYKSLTNKKLLNYQVIINCINIIKNYKFKQNLISIESNWLKKGRFILAETGFLRKNKENDNVNNKLEKSKIVEIKNIVLNKNQKNKLKFIKKIDDRKNLRITRYSDGVTCVIKFSSIEFITSYKDGHIRIFDSEFLYIISDLIINEGTQIECMIDISENNIEKEKNCNNNKSNVIKIIALAIENCVKIIKIKKTFKNEENNTHNNNINFFDIYDYDYIWEPIQVLENLHIDAVKKILLLTNNTLISAGQDSRMVFYKKNNYKNIYEKILIKQCIEEPESLLQINENYFVSSSFVNKCIRFYNIDDKECYENIDTINNIMCSGWPNSMNMLNKDILCVGGKGLFLIDINVKEIICKIEEGWIQCVTPILKDGTFLIAGEYDDKGKMYGSEYNISQYILIEGKCIYKIGEKYNADGFNIRDIIELDNNCIISMSWCSKLKAWE